MRIVVVEDEMCIREGLVKLLERIDRAYLVVGQADNGKSGLELIKESKPDPEIFRVAAEKIGCKPEECLVLEDSEAGLRAGIALGGAIIYIPDIAIVPEQVTAKVTETLADLGKVIGWLEAHRCNAK